MDLEVHMRYILGKGWRLLALLMCLLILYTGSMLLAYSFPDAWIEKNVQAAVAILDEEGNMAGGYSTYFWHSGMGIADNLTDKVIYSGLLRQDRTLAQAAMRSDYARYWHGYAVLMRPLSIVLSIINIRYLNMMLMFSLFVLCYWECRRQLGAWTAFAFVAGLLMSSILLAPYCQQYCTVYLITLLSCYVLLRFWPKLRRRLPECFLVVGSLVCFFDFLTFPILALGYPLLLCLMLQMKDGTSLWKSCFVLSAVWMAGYGLTWLGKALCGALLGQENILADIMQQAALRTTGNYSTTYGTEPVTAWEAISYNLDTFFTGSNIGFFFLCLLGYFTHAFVRRSAPSRWLRYLPLLAVAAYPLVWYAVLQNHVRMHFWMTYKMLAVTVFACLSFLSSVCAETSINS